MSAGSEGTGLSRGQGGRQGSARAWWEELSHTAAPPETCENQLQVDPGDLTRSRDTDTGKTAAAAGLVPLQTSPGGAPAQEAGRKSSSSSSPLPTSVRRPGPCARTKSSVVSVGKLLPGAGWLSPASLFLSRSHPQISVPLATSLLHTPSPGNSHHTAGQAEPLP